MLVLVKLIEPLDIVINELRHALRNISTTTTNPTKRQKVHTLTIIARLRSSTELAPDSMMMRRIVVLIKNVNCRAGTVVHLLLCREGRNT